MAQNLQIDPVKRDYVIKNGSPVPSDRVLEAAYYALTIPENAWLYGAVGQGSLIYTLENGKRTANLEQRFAAFASDAVRRQLVATGKATDVAVSNLATSRTGTSNNVQVVPSANSAASALGFSPV